MIAVEIYHEMIVFTKYWCVTKFENYDCSFDQSLPVYLKLIYSLQSDFLMNDGLCHIERGQARFSAWFCDFYISLQLVQGEGESQA